MAEGFLPDLFAGGHRFDDLNPGPIEFGIMFGAIEHVANHNRVRWNVSIKTVNGALHYSFSHPFLNPNQDFSQSGSKCLKSGHLHPSGRI